jgi:general secretion pathway protein G
LAISRLSDNRCEGERLNEHENLRRDEVCAGSRGGNLISSMGFTLLELMVSLAIVGILSAIAIPLYGEYIERARVVAAVADIRNISLTITVYNIDNDKYPQSLADVGYITRLDPWRSPYQYLNIQTAKGKGQFRKDRFVVPINTDYDLYSMGKDGNSVPPLTAKASRDDIIRANNGAYIGLASEF